MRSKQLNETSELVCISSAMTGNPLSLTNIAGKDHQKSKKTTSVAPVAPAESLGMKSKCNYIRKFTPLGKYFGVTKGNGKNPLL